MQHWLNIVLLLTTFPAHAQNCPRLEGRFRCRGAEPFDLTVENQFATRYAVYKITDATNMLMIFADGRSHHMDFAGGRGQYVAQCDGRSLRVESTSPDGEILGDQYYIDRAALIKLTINKTTNQISLLSCAPTHGTWNLYPH